MPDRRITGSGSDAASDDGWWFAAVVVVCLAAVALALVSQHWFDLQPCPWCVLQRLILLVIAFAALIGGVWRTVAARAVAAAGVFVFSLAGIAAALWQHFKAAASASCNLTLADKVLSGLHLDTALPAVFEPRASCADAAVRLMGLPYDFWSLGLFTALGITGVILLRRQRG